LKSTGKEPTEIFTFGAEEKEPLLSVMTMAFNVAHSSSKS